MRAEAPRNAATGVPVLRKAYRLYADVTEHARREFLRCISTMS